MQKLSDHDRSLLRVKQNYEQNKKRYVRITAILMRDSGYSASEIAQALGVDNTTVYRYIKRFFDSESLDDYLRTEYKGRPSGLSSAELMQLCDALVDRLFRCSGEVVAYIEKTFGIRFSRGHVRRLLRDLGFSFKKTRSIPAKADPQKQKEFLSRQLKPLLSRAKKASEPVYFADAAHPEHNTRPAYGWIPKGYEFCVKTTSGRQRVNLNAAVNAHDPTDIVCHQVKRVNAETTIELFKELQRRHKKGKIHVVCDNATYYKCRRVREWLKKHPRIRVKHLPPYSPNLNLIERLWKYLRKTLIDTTYYEKLADFRVALKSFFENIKDHAAQLKSLLRPNFHINFGLAN